MARARALPLLLAGYLAGMLEFVERGAMFHFLGGQADFFLILVAISLAAGVLLLASRLGCAV